MPETTPPTAHGSSVNDSAVRDLHINTSTRLHTHGGASELQVNTHFAAGSITAISGDSGAGKSTLLRIIAGVQIPDHGEIRYGDRVWLKGKINVPTRERRVGMVFQDYALFPNQSVRQQLRYAQRRHDAAAIDNLLERMALAHLADKKPAQLSGGQQQRLALARTLAAEPQILLLDEALSALDRQLRANVQQYLLEWQQQRGATLIIVSHDFGDIFRMANRVLHLVNGRVIADGSAAQVLLAKHASADLQFIGTVIGITSSEFATHLSIACGQKQITTLANPELHYALGQTVVVSVATDNAAVAPISDLPDVAN